MHVGGRKGRAQSRWQSLSIITWSCGCLPVEENNWLVSKLSPCLLSIPDLIFQSLVYLNQLVNSHRCFFVYMYCGECMCTCIHVCHSVWVCAYRGQSQCGSRRFLLPFPTVSSLLILLLNDVHLCMSGYVYLRSGAQRAPWVP